MTSPITGYAEGFYGRLLSWPERRQIVDTLHLLGLTSYYYAPKEDPLHRLHWRTPYSKQWREDFKRFCEYAHQHKIRVIAGVAPGLDFDFSELPNGDDFASLVAKSTALLEDGADDISLLMDDIDADFDQRRGRFEFEGQAHAALANALGDALTATIWVTPRIYADELIIEAVDYLPTFVSTLNVQHCVLYCGSDVVAHTLDATSANALCSSGHPRKDVDIKKHRVIIWDNLYANDYCPRKLFIGPWARRNQLQDVLLNPTGMVHTDCLLLELMAVELLRKSGSDTDTDTDTATASESSSVIASNAEINTTSTLWQSVLQKHGVPDEFHVLAPYFNHPVFNTNNSDKQSINGCVNNDEVRAAIEYCLWRWKTPLSREWYAFIFGLKHDLLMHAGQHPPDRILKTQTQPLAEVLLSISETKE